MKTEQDARIVVVGVRKGEYYRTSILGQKVEIIAGRYRSERLAIALERMLEKIEKRYFHNDLTCKMDLRKDLGWGKPEGGGVSS